VTRREWAWLGAALLVAGVAVLALVAFGSYERGYEAAAAGSANAEVAASRLSALQSDVIADGRLPPAMGGRVGQLLGSIQRELRLTGTGGATAQHELLAYGPAIRAELRLVAAGHIALARRVDDRRADPVYQHLGTGLRRLAAGNSEAARRAGQLAEAGSVAAVGVCFIAVLLLLARFAATRRDLAVGEAEHRLLRRHDRAKSELISVVSHDLRTPLTTIIGYLELLADERAGPVTTEQRKLLQVMRRNGGRLRAITDDLLFIADVEDSRIAFARAGVHLERVAADAIEAQQPQVAEEDISLSLVAFPSPQVIGDRRRLDDLIDNLLSNAVKFTPPGGSVEVAVRPVDGHVRLEVSDTGAGISAEDQEHLFERFFRSPDMTGMPGVGLGLAIVKAIADAHHARIGVRSILGRGTTFLVEFPAAAGLPGGDGSGGRPAAGGGGGPSP
jgi:signal transduction histidine kinase